MNPGTYREHIVARLAQIAPQMPAAPLKRAAVLIPIVARSEPTVLFTRRTEHLPAHAGQVCFPGGRVQADDTSLAETALREMEEETGIARARVAVAGFLDPYETNSGYAVLPVVGFLDGDFVLAPNHHEVADVFEVPLAYILDPASRVRREIERQGVKRQIEAIEHGGHMIWGVTAAIIANFCEHLLRP